ncbi:MAG: M48 family metalloprotease [Xanthomonadales bacterium]|jgi:predicted Zn-dependent protease|nr:M48 family metalloprotease [Xanthomonadales bacterium]
MESSTRVKILIAMVVMLTSLACVAQTEQLDLPDMGASADAILSRSEEEAYAKALVHQMRAYEVLEEDPLISAFFEDMGYRLASNSDRPDKSFTFVVLNQDVVNAFAAPGGVIALYSGLILAADDENEVAGVLAHEIAHVTQQHLYRALENQQAMTIPIALAMLAIALAGGGDGEAIQGAMMAGQAAAAQSAINYTRQNEYEADRIGISTLSRAGYDPAGMPEFFEKMGRINRSMGEGPPEFLRTHPVSVSRIAEAENRAANMPTPEPSDGRDFYLVQARLRVKSEDSMDDVLDWFNHRKERADITAAESDAIDYGKAIALQRKGQYAEARRLLESLIEREPHLAYELQLAELDQDSGDPASAVDRLAGLYNSFPGNHTISLHYAESLLRSNDPAQAETAAVILRQQLPGHTDDPRLYELYARSANISGDRIRAKEAIAESYYLRGGVHEAAMQLQELAGDSDLDYYQRSRITARINELRLELAKMGKEETE